MTAQSASREPTPAKAWWTLAVLWATALISYMHRLVLGAIVDPLSAELRISDTQLGLLQGAAFAIVYVLTALPMGRLADAGYRRSLLAVGTTVWCSGTILCAFAPDFAALFAGRLILGLGEAALFPVAAAIIGRIFPSYRQGTAFGILLVATAVGGPGAITIGGILLDAAGQGAFADVPILGSLTPWRTVLFTLGSVGLILPLLALTMYDRPTNQGSSRSIPPSIRSAIDWAAGAKWFFFLLAGVALMTTGDYALLSWLPTSLSRRFNWGPLDIGTTFGLITMITGIIGPLLGGVLGDHLLQRFGEPARMKMMISAIVLATAGGFLTCAPSPWMVLVGLAFWTLFSGAATTAGISAIQSLAPEGLKATAMAAGAFCNTLIGLGLGPIAVAMITERGFGYPGAVGYAIALTVVPLAILAACSIWLASRRSRRLRQGSPVISPANQ